MSDTTAQSGPMLAADGTPLKVSLARALRRQKLRALMLIAPLLLFIVLTFLAPIFDMLFRSVENQIVSETVPTTVRALADWDSEGGELPGEAVFEALYFDLFAAAEAKEHTKLGSRLNYEQPGISSLFRTSGRKLDDLGKDYQKPLEKLDKSWGDAAFWFELMTGGDGPRASGLLAERQTDIVAMAGVGSGGAIGFEPSADVAELLPLTARAYTDFAVYTALVDNDIVAEEEPWESVFAALGSDLRRADVSGYSGPGAAQLQLAAQNLADLPDLSFKEALLDIDKGWGEIRNWQTMKLYSSNFTPGYFLNAVDAEMTSDGVQLKSEDERIYLFLFWRTILLSVMITTTCLLFGYPIAWLLANLPLRTSNLLMILVLLPFWTSLLVRTSAWIVLLQQQGVINDVLVTLGIIGDQNRLQMMFNQTGTIIAMTHILLPFMILPLYSVMKTIPPSYVRAAKSLGATDWTAFWRVYFPQTIPGIGAGAILVFIVAIGYYITPELVGGTSGIFISNRIAYHISSSLNWGLGAALGVILLTLVLVLYWTYDKIVGIDNVKLG